MKSTIFAVGLVVLVFGVAILAQTQTESAEQELMKLENEWMEAVVKHDTASIEKLSRMQADEFIHMFDGSIFTKAQIIELVKSRKEEILSYVVDEWMVRVYGDAAVVMGRVTMKMQSADKETTDQSRFTDTWIKRDGRWQCVAAHNSTIAQK
ncbi:MAG: nuclear transport factor 2 family protein [Candidatus Aminicenantes bacterium]|nr:nuclear transport factor 2 family protein [Candidatus Aminicenantes bacterium]